MQGPPSGVLRYQVQIGSTILEYDLNIESSGVPDNSTQGAPVPDWARLDFHQCPNCPLRVADSPRCPAAVAIAPLLPDWGGLNSHQEMSATVITSERTVTAQTTAQRALSSLLGLVMALSACPKTTFLRPMARFHLPFASEQETLFRSVCAYLLRQYFRHQRGEPVDLNLSGLVQHYRELEVVNQSLAERLRAASDRDATINAITLLDIFTKVLPASIDDSLEQLAHLFVGDQQQTR